MEIKFEIEPNKTYHITAKGYELIEIAHAMADKLQDDDLTYTVEEAAEYLQVHPNTLYSWIKLKYVQPIKRGRKYIFRKRTLDHIDQCNLKWQRTPSIITSTGDEEQICHPSPRPKSKQRCNMLSNF